MNAERKPLAKAPLESTEPWTVRVRPSLRAGMKEEAMRREQDESEYARDALAIGHAVCIALRVGEAYIRIPA